jgi:hypothetical protein
MVRDNCARGVRLTDGTMIDADLVISTAGAPETDLSPAGRPL